MATFDINEVARRVQSTSTGQTAFTFNFQVNAASEIQVYVDDTLKELSTHYTVALNADGTGTVNFGSATSSGELITIIGDQPLSRTTSFQVGQVNNPTTLETEFDNLTIRQQQLKEMMDRSIQLKPSTKRTVTGTGTSGPLQFPYDATASNNANKIVKFDSNGTALELGSTTTNIDTLAGVSTEIALLGTSGNVTAMGLLGTSAAVADMALLGTSDVIADMALLADSAVIADMAILATTDVVSDLNTLATSDIVTDINLLATSDIVSDLNTLATSDIVSDLNTLATSDIVTDINVLATSDIVSDLNTLATSDFVSDLNTLASSTVVANIATVASNVSGVNSFAARYRVGSSDPSSDNDAGDLAFNTTSNTLKFFDGSSYNAIATTFSIDAASDTNLSSPADGALLLYDTGTSKFIDNVVSGDATLADTGALTIANNAVTTDKIVDNAVTIGKMADDSVGSAELVDNSVGAAALNISGNGSSGQMIVSDADGSFSYADQPSGGLTAVAVSGTTPTLDWSAGNVFTQALSGNTTYSFSNVPSGASSIEMLISNVGRRNDYNSHIAGTTEDIGGTIGTQAQPRSMIFNNDGSKVYISSLTDNKIYQFTLSTNYDVSTASYDSKVTGAGVSNFRLLAGFNADGTRIITADGDTIHEYTLTSAYDISTVSHSSANHSVDVTSLFNTNYGGGSIAPVLRNLQFSSDGKKLFMQSGLHKGDTYSSGTLADENTIPSVTVISLSGAYDIDSTLAVFSQFDPYMDINESIGGTISADGRYMVFYAQDPNNNTHFSGGNGVSPYQVFYNEEGGYDVSKARGAGHNRLHKLQNSSATELMIMRISPDGKFLYTHELHGSNNNNPIIRQYLLSSGHQVTMPSAVTSLPTTFGDGHDPATVSYLKLMTVDGGTNVYITANQEILP